MDLEVCDELHEHLHIQKGKPMYRYEYSEPSTMKEDTALCSGLWKANIWMQVLELHYILDESDFCRMLILQY